jgi:hypothetical protein
MASTRPKREKSNATALPPLRGEGVRLRKLNLQEFISSFKIPLRAVTYL